MPAAEAAGPATTFRVDAVVTQASGVGPAAVGDALVLEYTFDAATPASYETPIFATYPATSSMSLTIAGAPVASAPSGTISVANDVSTGTGPMDEYRADFFDLVEASPQAPFTLESVFLQMTSFSDPISGVALPATPPDPTQFVYFDSPYVALTYTDGVPCPDWDPCSPQYVIASVTGISVVSAGPDADGDGVADAIGSGPGAFDDGTGTTGQITSGSGLLVEDAAAPAGVRITTTSPVSLVVCGLFSISLGAGSDVTLTCGSVTVQVAAGVVSIDTGATGFVTVPAGGDATVDLRPDDDYQVTNHGTIPITITRGGATATVAGGKTAVAASGQTVPLIDLGDDVVLGSGAALSRTAALVDPDFPDSWLVTVDYGDGAGPQVQSNGPTKAVGLTHAYGAAGNYVVTVAVTDAAGAVATDTLTVRVLTPKATVLRGFDTLAADLGVRSSVASSLRLTLATAATLAERGRVQQARLAIAAYRAEVAVALVARRITKPQAQSLTAFGGSAATTLGL